MFTMNPRIEKLRAEQQKDLRRREALEQRISERAEELKRLENTDIVGLVEELGMNVDQFFALMNQMKKDPIPGNLPAGSACGTVEPVDAVFEEKLSEMKQEDTTDDDE